MSRTSPKSREKTQNSAIFSGGKKYLIIQQFFINLWQNNQLKLLQLMKNSLIALSFATALFTMAGCSDDDDFQRKYIAGEWESAQDKTEEYDVIYNFKTYGNDTESWGDVTKYHLYADGSQKESKTYDWHVMSEPKTPKLMTIEITPKGETYEYTESYTVIKLTASEMWLKGVRTDINGKQTKEVYTPGMTVIKLTRHTAKK